MTLLVLVTLASACSGGREPVDPASISFPPPTTSESTTTTVEAVPFTMVETVPEGGDVRVGMWADPDPAAPTLAGAAVRSLILPQLFTPTPGGGWSPSLVEPGSDRLAPDQRSVTLRLRPGAVWSDGTPITVDDLRAGADATFVTGISDDGRGNLTVRFNQPLPGWRNLWSGRNVVPAPRSGVYGGPWMVGRRTEGLETVLVPNPRWWGDRPHLDSLTLVVVPDQTTMLELLGRGELDVVAPWPAPGLMARLGDLDDVTTESGTPGGWQLELVANPERLSLISRQAALGALDPGELVGSLLAAEAVAPPFGSGAPDPSVQPGSLRQPAEITLPEDVPMAATVARAVQFAVRDGGGVVPEQRVAPSDQTEAWMADLDFDLAVELVYLGPSPCRTCRWAWIDETTARLTDGGAPATDLDEALRNRAADRILWQPVPLVAWNRRVHGPVVNGFAPSVAWNSQSWWIEG